MKITYSVVMVTYYHEKYIRKAIDSVVSQTVFNEVEILIGDDGSKDNTVSILNEYANKYPQIHVFVHENVGLSKNVYSLLKKAKGQYIAILEGDDFWIDPEKLEKQKEIIEKNGCIATACNSLIITDEGVKIGLWNELIPEGILSKKQILHYQTTVCHPSGVMLKNIFAGSGEKYDVIEKASRMGGNHTGMINLLGSIGPFYLDTIPRTVWRIIQKTGAKNYSSQKLVDPINYLESLRKYEMYEDRFNLGYERHIYEEYCALNLSIKKEIYSKIGKRRFYIGKVKYFLYRCVNFFENIVVRINRKKRRIKNDFNCQEESQ